MHGAADTSEPGADQPTAALVPNLSTVPAKGAPLGPTSRPLGLQKAESVDSGESIEMIPGSSDDVSDVRRSHVCVEVLLRLPLLDGDKCARCRVRGKQIVGNAAVVTPACGNERL